MSPDSEARAADPRAIKIGLVAFVLLALVVAAGGLWMRGSQAETLKERANAQSVRTVAIVSPKAAAATTTLDLPGRIEAHARAPIYARVSGYLKRWYADIGTPVKAGQLLAEIETPDLDQQLLQARAELATARANVELAESTSKRWQALLKTDSVSRQEADEKAGDLAAKAAVTKGLEANVQRFEALKQFTRLVAPFDGVVTARNTDVGALINVGGTPGSELFVVSDTRQLRVYVSVPQVNVALTKRGAVARVSVPEHPGQTWPAVVQSTAQAVSTSTGTMLVQLTVDNAGAQLLPGGYADVVFPVGSASSALSVPPGALIFDKSGLRVATVDASDHIVLKDVTVARDLGSTVEIGSGLLATDRVVDSPPDGVENGDLVHVAAAR
jgi:RND family efflux transporter MFP subunit